MPGRTMSGEGGVAMLPDLLLHLAVLAKDSKTVATAVQGSGVGMSLRCCMIITRVSKARSCPCAADN